jgi:hypothetical protein
MPDPIAWLLIAYGLWVGGTLVQSLVGWRSKRPPATPDKTGAPFTMGTPARLTSTAKRLDPVWAPPSCVQPGRSVQHARGFRVR